MADDDKVIAARRRAIQPVHFKLTRDPIGGNVFLALNADTAALPTFVGCDDLRRFDPDTREYLGPNVHEMAQIELEYAGT